MKDSTRTLRLALAASALLLGAPLQAETQSVPPLPADDLLLETDSAADNRRASEARGVLRAAREALLSSELAGRITEIPHAEGETFAKGAVLVRFDCSAYQAQRQAAEAAVRAAREELGNKRQLASLNSVGRFEVSLAEARQAQAQLFVSAGADLLPDALPDSELQTLATALAEGEARWDRGEAF